MNGVRTIEPRSGGFHGKFFLQVSTREREIFATKSPGLPGPCSFLLNFPEGSREGRPSQKVLEVGVGLPVPKYRERAWNEGRSGKMGGSQGCGSWKEEMVSTKHPIMTSLSRVC